MDEHRKFDPLPEDHPVVGEVCPGCRQKFVAGDVVTLVFIGPGDDEEAQEKARAGRVYTGVAVPAHWTCVTGHPV